MNNFTLGTPEHAALERLKTMRLIGGTGLMDDVVSGIITEVGECYRSWAAAEQTKAEERATELALEAAHTEFEDALFSFINAYEKAFNRKLDELQDMHERALTAMRAIREGNYNFGPIADPEAVKA